MTMTRERFRPLTGIVVLIEFNPNDDYFRFDG